MWDPNSITQDRLHELRKAAEQAWRDDSRHEKYRGHAQPSAGHCYQTSRWLTTKLGGFVGNRDGHHFWVSPDESHVIDLTGDRDAIPPIDLNKYGLPLDEEDEPWVAPIDHHNWRPGPILYKKADHPLYDGFEIDQSPDLDPAAAYHTALFSQRADSALGEHTADWTGIGKPMDLPQAQENKAQEELPPLNMAEQHMTVEPQENEYRWVYANGQLHVSPEHDHDRLRENAGVQENHKGPFAAGFVHIQGRKALWSGQSNVALRNLVHELKAYTKEMGWEWEGLVGPDGNPIHDDFGPKKSMWFRHDGDNLIMAEGEWQPFKDPDGVIRITGKKATPEYFGWSRPDDIIEEWASDFGYRIAEEEPSWAKKRPDRPDPREDPWGYHQVFREEAREVPLEEWQKKFREIGVQRQEDLMPHSEYTRSSLQSKLQLATGNYRHKYNPNGGNMAPPTFMTYWGMRNGNHFFQPQGTRGREYSPQEVQGWLDNGELNVYMPPSPMVIEDLANRAKEQTSVTFPDEWNALGEERQGRTAEYPGGTNMTERMRNFETLEMYDKGDMEWEPEKNNLDNEEPKGPLDCPVCGEQLPDYKAYQLHTHDHENKDWLPIEDGHFPQLNDKDEPLPLRLRNVNPLASPVAGSEGKDLIEAPIPFIYDIEKDNIITGQPGMRPSDIMIQKEDRMLTKEGLVQGYYEPGGKVVITTTTNQPYSTYHMLQLWYYQHPHMEITSLELEDQKGEKTKLASEDVGTYIKNLTATEPAAYNAYQALRREGGHVYIVGGAVRDALLQKEPRDLDMLVQGLPSVEVQRILAQLPGTVDLEGKRFGTYKYRYQGHEVEIALPRIDSYEDAEKRSQGKITVDHRMPVEDDLLRRDFTANSMAVDLNNGRLIDPYGGAEDINKGALRTTHPSSFKEDPTRLLRALVAHSRFGLNPDEKTRQEMASNASRLDAESPDILKPILDKLMSSDNPSGAFRLAQETGILKHIFPELGNNFDYDQNNLNHKYTLGDHTLHVLDNISRKSDDPDLRLAALLHDIGKPSSAWIDPDTGRSHFYQGMIDGRPVGADHALVGADLAEKRLRQTFNYPVAKMNRIRGLIENHMFPAFSSAKGARKFLNRVGDHADDLLLLRESDQGGKGQSQSEIDARTSADQMRGYVNQVRQAGEATDKGSLAINGNDILALGVRPGPQIGQILQGLVEQVIADPQLNNRDSLLQLAQNYVGQNNPNSD